LERTPSILPESLPDAPRGADAAAYPVGLLPAGGGTAPPPVPEKGLDLEQHVQHLEREYIAEALRRSNGVKVKAAELLGMSFRSFRYYMKKYNRKEPPPPVCHDSKRQIGAIWKRHRLSLPPKIV